MRVFVAGATGYIGRAVVEALLARGHEVVAFSRPRAGVKSALGEAEVVCRFGGAEVRFGDVTDPASVRERGFAGEAFDAVVSCLASRTGAPADAWRIEHEANLNLLRAADRADHFVYLSAICVQHPKLAFQHAKLAFEAALAEAPILHSIVRPTAFFKSLSGQVERVKAGRPFLVFGDGELTACKPIAEAELAAFMAEVIEAPGRFGRILPIGGPGPALTPRAQGEMLFELLGRPPRFRHVPVRLLDAIIGGLGLAGRLVPRLADKAELARIGRYYATESMLVRDPETGHYDAAATPEYGDVTLRDHYTRILREGMAGQELGDHAVF